MNSLDIPIHQLASHPLANLMLPKFNMPRMRKSGFPYFTKLSPVVPLGTPPSTSRRRPTVTHKLSADELEALLK